ncbi:MAG: GTPase, partial [Arsenophonus sp. ER-LPS3-MAG3]
GEFSERAFLNNKIDLTQAEAIADLIDASSEHAARSAINSLQGIFSQQIYEIVKAITELRIYIESNIDFQDEEINFLSNHEIEMKLKEIKCYLDKVRLLAYQGNLLREGIRVVITGLPNSGKSSLLNALSGRETAIVTDISGTTRDVLHECIYINGIQLHIIDT